MVLFVCLGVWGLGVWRFVRGVCIVHVGSFAQAGLRFDWVILYAARSAGPLCYRNRVFLSLDLAGSCYPQGDIRPIGLVFRDHASDRRDVGSIFAFFRARGASGFLLCVPRAMAYIDHCAAR